MAKASPASGCWVTGNRAPAVRAAPCPPGPRRCSPTPIGPRGPAGPTQPCPRGPLDPRGTQAAT
eukprot:15474866-Alexandrium_andersonii.AAC.1